MFCDCTLVRFSQHQTGSQSDRRSSGSKVPLQGRVLIQLLVMHTQTPSSLSVCTSLKKRLCLNPISVSCRLSVSSHAVTAVYGPQICFSFSQNFHRFHFFTAVNATNNRQTGFSKAVPKLKLNSISFTLILLSKVHVRTHPHASLVPMAINQSGPHLGLKGVLGRKASPSEKCTNGSLGGSFYLCTTLLYGAQLFDLKIPPLMRSLLNN